VLGCDLGLLSDANYEELVTAVTTGQTPQHDAPRGVSDIQWHARRDAISDRLDRHPRGSAVVSAPKSAVPPRYHLCFHWYTFTSFQERTADRWEAMDCAGVRER
jgi:hypothetical protein